MILRQLGLNLLVLPRHSVVTWRVSLVTPSTVQETEPVIPASNLLRARMPELDTIRGIAVLLVLFFHGFGFRL